MSPNAKTDRFHCGQIFMMLAALATCIAVLFAVIKTLSLPIVYESYSTGQCVRVDDPAGVYSCENMPTKFHHEWVW